ncbi:MAG: hypothetical protein R3B13_32190 [Polyangiaceae bacterium]
MRPLQLGLLVGLASAATACDGCNREDKPYTPFVIASVSGTSVATDAGPEPDAELGGTSVRAFTRKLALVARPPAARFRLEDRALNAPPGRLIERGLLGDFDADGTFEAVVFTLAAAAGAAPGELHRIDAGGTSKRLTSWPSFVPSGPNCRLAPELAQTGKSSVTLDVRGVCEGSLLGHSPTRSLEVIAPMRERPVVVALRLVDPSPRQPLDVSVDSADRDGDGRDDVALQVRVKFAGRTQTAEFLWLDRASGAARDVARPRTGLLASARRARAAARRSASAKTARSDVGALRLLMLEVCGPSGVASVLDHEGTPLGCGDLTPLLDELAQADVTAALSDKDVLEAFAAFDRAAWFLAGPSDKAQGELRSALEKAAPRIPAKVLLAKAEAPARTRPGFLPIAFASSEGLWVQTADGVATVLPDGSVAREEAGSAQAWPLDARRADGKSWSQVIFACDGPVVRLGFEGGAGMDTALLSPRPGACTPGSSFRGPAAVAMGDKDGALVGLLGANWIGPRVSIAEATLRPQPKGTARSANGKYFAAVTSLGVLVSGSGQTELWTADAFSSHPGLRCTVNDDATQLACVSEKGRVLLLSKS